ncbi:MAG: sugar ABC transporter substrate-binding protein [bacterium]
MKIRGWFFVLVLPLLASCGKQEARAPGVTLTWWQFWEGKIVEPLIKDFEAENPGINIDYQQLTWANGLDKITIALASGTGPDICELGSTWVARFAHDEVLIDITNEVEALKDEYRMWEPVTYQGKIYGLPWVVGTRALFYNRTLFRQAKLDPDSPPTTWDELLEAAKAIRNLGPEIYGYGINAGERYVLYKKFMPFAWGNGGDVLDGNKCVLDSPEVKEALKFYLNLAKYGLAEKQDVLDNAFKRGVLGMHISGAWNLKRIPEEAADLDFGVALIPKPSATKGRSASFAGGEMLVLFKGCQHKKEALSFLRFLTREDNAVRLCREVKSVAPAAAAAINNEYYLNHPKEMVFLKQMEGAVAPPNHPRWVEIEEEVDTAIERALYGEDPDKALSEAKEKIEGLLGASNL